MRNAVSKAHWAFSLGLRNFEFKGEPHVARKIDKSAEEYEKAIQARRLERYVLKLYVTGLTPRSIQAIDNIKRICEEHLRGRYELEIIDVYQQPVLAKDEQILAAPTPIKKLPLPLRRLIGDMSKTDRILLGLDLKTKN